MKLRRCLTHVALGLGVALSATFAHADTVTQSGNFTTDDQVYTYDFSTTQTQSFSIFTTSYATGGFVPVLTLFDGLGTTTIDNSGPGTSDASLMDTLGAGSYILTLTEFPNVAVGPTLAQGFLFAGEPSITGDLCSMSGSMFVDDIDCSQRTNAYSLTVTSSPTPEPSSWLLVLPGLAVLAVSSRRRGLI